MVFSELVKYCQLKAIADALYPTYESFYRSVCRSYSRNFHVPLPDVEKLDPENVLSAYFENEIEGIDIEEHLPDLLEKIYTIEDPDYIKKQDENLDDIAAMVEKREQERLANKSKKSLPKKDKPGEEKRTGGKLTFDNLDEKLEK